MSSDDEQYLAWRDVSLSAAERVADLLPRMRREEKVAQLVGVWIGAAGGDEVAPHQHEFVTAAEDFGQLIADGLGQLTRPFGTAPTEPRRGVEALAKLQQQVIDAGRFGIPALAHEECLSGFMAAGATIYPTPLAWGATFDSDLVGEIAAQVGESMSAVGIHQGLAPVLDVTVDPRWGRTEETIGEDPYLVGSMGVAYVRGLQRAGVVATLKHFVGYSASRDARNFAPVGAGPRELADVFTLPFEMAVRLAEPGSVMHSYAEIDGVPVAASRQLLDGLLRRQWGFDGTVVSDYFAIAFLHRLHRVAAGPAEAAAAALTAGIDVELPSGDCYREPLLAGMDDGAVDEALVDRAVDRVLLQKCRLGMLDPDWRPTADHDVDLDPPSHRRLARRAAEESAVLLSNRGGLPLSADARIAGVGAAADRGDAMTGCYAFDSHVGDSPYNVEVPSLLEGLREELPGAVVAHAAGCDVSGSDRSGIPAAVEACSGAEVCVAVVGDRAGLFGRGTSGEGCDREDHRLPGVQSELLDALLAADTPVVVVVLSGRPYALGAFAERAAAIVQTFFPGQAGAAAVAAVLSGRVNPSGRLPVGVPARPGSPAPSYLTRPLGRLTDLSSVDPTPLFAFGHGLSYTQFDWTDARLESPESMPADGVATVSVTVHNSGDRAGSEVVQLYLHRPTAQTTQPVSRLVGFAKTAVEPGRSRRVRFTVPADLASFTGVDGHRVVEPGEMQLWLGASSSDVRSRLSVTLTGAERVVDHNRRMVSEVEVS